MNKDSKILKSAKRAFSKEFDGLLARVIQHEIDHLNGNLIIDRVSKAEKIGINKDLKLIKENSLRKLESGRASTL